MGNAHLRHKTLADGSELQRRVITDCIYVICDDVKRRNLYVEQGQIGDEELPVPLKVSGRLQDSDSNIGT